MGRSIAFGRYFPGDSILHRLDPRAKLVSSIALIVSLFVAKNLWILLITGLLTCAFVRFSRVPVKELLRSLKPILFLIVFAFMIHLITAGGDVLWTIGPLKITMQGIRQGSMMAVRLCLMILLSTLFLTLTSTPMMIADALERLLAPLAKLKVPVHELAMMMSIALRFVPTLIEETDKIMKAQSSRGADYDTGGFISKLRGLVRVLVPLFVSAFRRADELADAMEARCYRGGVGRTKLYTLAMKRKDWLFLSASIAYLVLCIVC